MIKKIIEVSLQDLEMVKNAIEHNKANEYEFIIRGDDSTIVSTKCLEALYRQGYSIDYLIGDIIQFKRGK